ncbi:inositol 1,4,5-trisphosphate receptor-interacting protein-like 1 [Cyrtonyx montezumae]|uniref:inositol 1,4,5-trisphosphate receptor-interacting protein-like 1 n=1 Tax=Cyrtonyx montezumae TaxID=9017 RepID=UPI0032DA4D45
MALAFDLVLFMEALPCVGDELNEETLKRMQQRAEFLREKMTELLQEVEQRERYHSRMGMQALLFAVLPFWKFVTVLCVFGLLFWFVWKRQKEFHGVQVSRDEESSSSEEEQAKELEQVQYEEEEIEDQQEQGQYEEEEIEDQQEQGQYEEVLPESFWPNQHLKKHGEDILRMVNVLINIGHIVVLDTFFPIPERSFMMGSTYEGWSLLEEETVFCLLVSMKPPRGHIFFLEVDTTQELPVKNSCIRVQLKCTCGREQNLKMLCFLHTSADELKDQQPSLLDTLCTGPYLDVEKTASWFMSLFQKCWKCLPQSAVSRLNVMLLKRSCRLQFIDMLQRKFLIEIKFGVQQGNTDIFLSSEETEAAYMPSTTWPQTCAVAEAKFFKHIAARAGEDSFHLECLKVCSYILRGYNFSIYELKTVLMHLLTKIPMESWNRRYFVLRMNDILRYLRCCLEEKRLDHFFIGNEAVPKEIILPWGFRVSRPPNLFQHLAQHPDKHKQALYEMRELQNRFTTLLTTGK